MYLLFLQPLVLLIRISSPDAIGMVYAEVAHLVEHPAQAGPRSGWPVRARSSALSPSAAGGWIFFETPWW